MTWSLVSNKENILPARDSAKKHGLNDPSMKSPSSSRSVRIRRSLLSLNAFRIKKKSSGENGVPIISQPTLDPSSHEKLRNKIKHSPSVLSVNALNGTTETNSDTEKRLLSLFFGIAHTDTIEPLERTYSLRPKSESRIVKAINIHNHRHATDALRAVEIHQLLSSCPEVSGFANYDKITIASTRALPSDGDLQCILEMPRAGTPLDIFQLKDSKESFYIILRVAEILANAERAFQFEHRNLHAGNVLVQRCPKSEQIVSVEVISCDLARITGQSTSSKTLYTSLEDPRFSKSKLPVVTKMRELIQDPASYAPQTNVLWLRYLVEFLYSKTPSSALKRAQRYLKKGSRKQPGSAIEALPHLQTLYY